MATPWIGLTPALNQQETHLMAHESFFTALTHYGAQPVLLPLTDCEETLSACVERLDGFILTGGSDLDPLCYGEVCRPWCGAIIPRRDEMELKLCRMLLAAGKPVLGICRGFQVMNVTLGGSLYQDLEKELETDEPLAHRQHQPDHFPAHSIALTPSSRLHHILGHETRVNSLHHQGIKRLGQGFICTAVSPDGLCEGAELTGAPFFVGVQWHPERMWQQDAAQRKLFEAFLAACAPDQKA